MYRDVLERLSHLTLTQRVGDLQDVNLALTQNGDRLQEMYRDVVEPLSRLETRTTN